MFEIRLDICRICPHHQNNNRKLGGVFFINAPNKFILSIDILDKRLRNKSLQNWIQTMMVWLSKMTKLTDLIFFRFSHYFTKKNIRHMK